MFESLLLVRWCMLFRVFSFGVFAWSEECKIIDVISCHIEFKRAIAFLFLTTITIACNQMLPVIWSQDFLRELWIELESIWHGVLGLLVSDHSRVLGLIEKTFLAFLRWTSLDNDWVLSWLLLVLLRGRLLLSFRGCQDLVDFYQVDCVLLI